MAIAIQSAYSVEGSGPPLILIHGIGASRHSWDGLIGHPEDRLSLHQL